MVGHVTEDPCEHPTAAVTDPLRSSLIFCAWYIQSLKPSGKKLRDFKIEKGERLDKIDDRFDLTRVYGHEILDTYPAGAGMIYVSTSYRITYADYLFAALDVEFTGDDRRKCIAHGTYFCGQLAFLDKTIYNAFSIIYFGLGQFLLGILSRTSAFSRLTDRHGHLSQE